VAVRTVRISIEILCIMTWHLSYSPAINALNLIQVPQHTFQAKRFKGQYRDNV